MDFGSVQVRSRAVLAQEPENLQQCPDQAWESQPCTGEKAPDVHSLKLNEIPQTPRLTFTTCKYLFIICMNLNFYHVGGRKNNDLLLRVNTGRALTVRRNSAGNSLLCPSEPTQGVLDRRCRASLQARNRGLYISLRWLPHHIAYIYQDRTGGFHWPM